MKRTSLHSIQTDSQISSKSTLPLKKYSRNYISLTQQQQTSDLYRLTTQRSPILEFSQLLFKDCFQPSDYFTNQKKTFRRLQHQSLNKKNSERQGKLDLNEKSLSSKNLFLFLKNEKTNSKQIEEAKSQGSLTNIIKHLELQKQNVLKQVKNRTEDSIEASMAQVSSKYNSKITLVSQKNLRSNSQNLVTSTLYLPDFLQNFSIKTITTQGYLKESSKYQSNTKKKRQSTTDSINIKQTQIPPLNSLQFGQILTQSIQFFSKAQFPNHCQNQTPFFQSNDLKDSLIGKLMTPKKSQKFSHQKRNHFIRSKKLNINNWQQNRWFRQKNLQSWKGQGNQQNQEDCAQQSHQAVWLKVYDRSKFASLDQCAFTVVSKYNNSSQLKSVLQESNIIFQASKLCEKPEELEQKKRNFFESHALLNKQTREDQENGKLYSSSLIEKLNADQKQKSEKNSLESVLTKKFKGGFLRKKDQTTDKQMRIAGQDEELSIRFDLNTFLEYGPL